MKIVNKIIRVNENEDSAGSIHAPKQTQRENALERITTNNKSCNLGDTIFQWFAEQSGIIVFSSSSPLSRKRFLYGEISAFELQDTDQTGYFIQANVFM